MMIEAPLFISLSMTRITKFTLEGYKLLNERLFEYIKIISKQYESRNLYGASLKSALPEGVQQFAAKPPRRRTAVYGLIPIS